MLNKNLLSDLILKIILNLALLIPAPLLYAASIHTLKPNNGPIQLLNSEANTFTLSRDLRNPDTGSMLSFSSPQAKANPLGTTATLMPSETKANSFQQQLLFKYSDNAMVQESLNALFEARLLWNDLDALAYEFSDEAIYSLKLDKFVDANLNNFQHPRSLQHDKVSKNVYDKARRTEQKSKKRNSGTIQGFDDSILSHLFRKQTLYYLLASLLIVSVLARIARFILGFFP